MRPTEVRRSPQSFEANSGEIKQWEHASAEGAIKFFLPV